MPEYLAPGVFVEEIDSGSKPIEGVSTSTAAFIGYAKSGEFNTPTLVTSWPDFCLSFGEEENATMIGLCQELMTTLVDLRGAKKASRKSWAEVAVASIAKAQLEQTGTVSTYVEFAQKYNVPIKSSPYLEGGYLAHAVNGFFTNGGSKAYVVRIPSAADVAALAHDQNAVARATIGPLLVRTREPGPSALTVEVTHPKPGKFALVVTDPEDKEHPVTIDGGGEGLDLSTVEDAVNGNADLKIRVALLDPRAKVPPPAATFKLTGGHTTETAPTLDPGNVLATIPQQIGAAPAQAKAGPLMFTAKEPGQEENGIAVELTIEDEIAKTFSLKISKGDFVEQFPPAPEEGATPTYLDLSTVTAVDSQLIGISVAPAPAGVTLSPPNSNRFVLSGGVTGNLPVVTAYSPEVAAGAPLVQAMNLTPGNMVGDDSSGAKSIAGISDISILCAPDLMAGAWQRMPIPGQSPDDVPDEAAVLTDRQVTDILAMQKVLLDFCELGRRMVILDSIPGLNVQQTLQSATVDAGFTSQRGQGAIYYPWIKVLDPINIGRQIFVPPCGHVAGMWARVSTTRGVHKAPANEGLMGAVALERHVSKAEQELLNPNGINCIRAFPGRGILVWGARTLATTSNPSWKYVNVRRYFNYLEETIDRGTQWTVFEPNDITLWGKIRRDVGAFLYTEWMSGTLFGAPATAYYVRCDESNNPPATRDLGRLYVEIGVNPVKPAEFVIFQIGQWSGGGSIMEA